MIILEERFHIGIGGQQIELVVLSKHFLKDKENITHNNWKILRQFNL